MTQKIWQTSACLVLVALWATSCRTQAPRAAAKALPAVASPHSLSEVESEQAMLRRVEAQTRFSTGLIYELNDEPASAREEFSKAALSDPANESLVLDVARDFLQSKQPERAREVLALSAKRPDSSGLVHAYLGLALADLGKTEEAVAANRECIRKLPGSLAGYQHLSQLYFQNGQTNQGVAVLAEAARQTNVDAGFLIDLAQIYSRYGQVRWLEKDAARASASALLERAEKLEPKSLRLLLKLADGYQSAGHTDKAIANYLKLLAQDGELPGLRAKLVEIYLNNNERAKAAEQLEAILKDNPVNPLAYYYLGIIAHEEKNYPKAIEHFEKGLLLSPDNEALYYHLAGVRLDANEPKEAVAVLEKAQAKFKPAFVSEFYFGLAYGRMKKYSEALKHLTAAEVIAQASDSKLVGHIFYFQAGSIAERNHDYPQAEKYFLKCLELSPNFAEALNYLGYMWADRGEHLEQAREYIQKAVNLEPKNAAFLDSLGWVLFKLRQPADALPHLQKAIELQPEPDPTLFDHLGDAHAALKQMDEARAAWQKARTEVEKEIARTDAAGADADPALFEQLGDLHAKLKEHEAARQAWRRALALEPNDQLKKKLEANLNPGPRVP